MHKLKSNQKIVSRKKQKINVKIVITIFFVIIALIFAIPLYFEYKSNLDLEVLKVNGEPITTKEFKMFMSNNVANTYGYFKQKYGVDDNATFWTSNYKGEVPLEYIKSKTLEEVKRMKIKQILFKQYGLIDDISFSAFQSSLKSENETRKEKVKKGQVIYGPQVYGENEFFNYIVSNKDIALKEKLSEKELLLSEDLKKELYNKNREKDYKNLDTMKVQLLTITWKGNNESPAKKKASEMINEVKNKLGSGEAFESISKQYVSSSDIEVKFEDIKIDDDARRRGSETYENAWEEMTQLREGAIGKIIEGNNRFALAKCIERKDAGYKSFDEVKDSIKTKYTDEKYEELLDKLVKEAKVEIVESNYNKLKVR